jgi:hypothetical protein
MVDFLRYPIKMKVVVKKGINREMQWELGKLEG